MIVIRELTFCASIKIRIQYNEALYPYYLSKDQFYTVNLFSVTKLLELKVISVCYLAKARKRAFYCNLVQE